MIKCVDGTKLKPMVKTLKVYVNCIKLLCKLQLFYSKQIICKSATDVLFSF